MTKQRAVHLKQASIEKPTSGLEVVETERPTPGQGEVLVRIHLRPVNPAGV
jgi:NADPH:quinone reductase-like Zn-dependent oxidoreductase